MNEARGVGLLAHAGHYSACSGGGQSAGVLWPVVLLALLSVGCVHPPASRFPATLAGPVTAIEEPLSSGEATPDAPYGPLRLGNAWVRSTAAGHRWHLQVENPTTSPFGVTIVLRLLDAGGATRASDSVSFAIGRHDVREIERELAEAPPGVTGWRLDAWVRVLPAPDRRTLGGTG